jgi:hypothetical protein
MVLCGKIMNLLRNLNVQQNESVGGLRCRITVITVLRPHNIRRKIKASRSRSLFSQSHALQSANHLVAEVRQFTDVIDE